MSGSAKALSGLFGMTEFMFPMVLDDLTDEQAYARPRGDGGPSIAWSIGHLLNYRVFMLNRFGVEWSNPWEARFGDVPASDGSGYPSLDDFRVAWNAVGAEFMSALDDLTEEQLGGQLEVKLGGRAGGQSWGQKWRQKLRKFEAATMSTGVPS